MKKKIFLLCLIALLFTGCTKESVDNKINKKEKSQDKILEGRKGLEYEWDCEIDLKDIKDISTFNSMFISKDGKLYEFSLTLKFSTTNNHCRKIDTDMTFEKFINGAIISTDKKIYGYYDGNFEERPHGWTGAFNYALYDYNENVLIYDGRDGIYGIAKDNKLYIYKTNDFSSDDIKSEKVLYEFDNDEFFVEAYGSIIKTNKAYYSYGIANRKDCEQYADIKCEYGIVKDEELTEAYNDIFYTNNVYFILKESDKIYTYVLGG